MKIFLVFSHHESFPSLNMPLSNVGHDATLLNNALFTLFYFSVESYKGIV